MPTKFVFIIGTIKAPCARHVQVCTISFVSQVFLVFNMFQLYVYLRVYKGV